MYTIFMTTEEKLSLINQVGEEIITEEDLKKLLESGEELVAYDGFEPSGQIHIAQGILRAININKLTSTGIKFKMLVADWHAMANNKMGGDLEKIKLVGKYFIEVWKAAGMDLQNVEFVWASDLVKNDEYWMLVLKIARTNGVNRFIRTAEIMGREESMDLTLAQLIYPAMQAADIFTLGAKMTQLGMDQRKVNMLAREVGPQLGFWKPVVVSHHMLMGLGKPPSVNSKVKNEENAEEKIKQVIALKMSKSLPDNAIFMTDTSEDVKRKITKAYCPEGEVKENPVLEYYRYILFEKYPQIILERPAKYGGAVILNSYQNLERLYAEKKIHPLDIKQTAVVLLDKLLQPVREHFTKNSVAKELLTKVKSFKVTR